MDQSLRYLSPHAHDIVQKLLEMYPFDYPNLKTQVQLVKIFKDSKKYSELLEKIESFIIKKVGFNFIIKNIPEFAKLQTSHVTVRVGLEEMKDTLEQTGAVETIGMVDDAVYAKLENPSHCHNLLNNMLLGNNIIRTKLC